MPLIMDDGLDDLFGDDHLGQGAAVPDLPSVPRALTQFVDDLRVSGCSQRVAWSNQGCIANLSADGFTLTLRALHCDPDTGLWRLSKGDEAKLVALVHDGHPLKHVSWSHPGTELAVIDKLGNISIYSLLISINRCTVSRRCVPDADDNLSAVVGLMWLNQERALSLYRPAVKAQNGQWVFGGSRFKQSGPHNPHLMGDQPGKNKAALVVVTRSGGIRLIYQGPDGGRWLDFKGELQCVSTAAELLTHAAVCADRDSSMLVATHSVSKRIRIYRVEVDWPSQAFIIDHVSTIADCSLANDDTDEGRMASSLAYLDDQLYHLEILPPGPDIRTKETAALLLLAFFRSSSDQVDHLPMGNEPSTSIVRWELSSSKPTLHPSFSQLASKRSAASNPIELQSEVVFSKLPGVSVRKFIVAVQQLNLSTTLVFCTSGGGVEFRNRTTLDLLPRDDTLDQASSVAQVGLEYPDGSPYTVEAVAEAFVMQFAISCSGYGNYHDDLSATMQLFQHQHLKGIDSSQAPRFINPFLRDVHSVSQLNIDFSGDIKTENYLKHGLHQRTLSMQHSLGYWGDESHRSLSSKIAIAILQLRWVALACAMGLKPAPSGTTLSGEAEFKRTETVRSFFGIISWTLSLMNYVVDEVFTLAAAMEENSAIVKVSSSEDAVTAKISELNTPALALVFVSQSRLLFKYIFRFFRGIALEITQQRSQDPIWHELGNIFSTSPVPLHRFELMLASVDKSIRSIYESGDVSEADRRDIEKSMLITGSVSPKLWPAVESLLTNTVKSLREEVNVAELYFHDVSWLGLSDDKASDQWRKAHGLDVIRKVVLPEGARIRQCTRCCSVMEDIAPPRGTASWLANMWRNCICGNWWMSLEGDQTGNVTR
ncbi:MAG: hypothetical protein Q9211_004261 [Gyalolechia sp. 1 TL-2023]